MNTRNRDEKTSSPFPRLEVVSLLKFGIQLLFSVSEGGIKV
jgi:hypothetical protein